MTLMLSICRSLKKVGSQPFLEAKTVLMHRIVIRVAVSFLVNKIYFKIIGLAEVLQLEPTKLRSSP